MKNSVAKQVSHKIILTLSVALAVLFVGSFVIVFQTVYNENQNRTRAMVSLFCDIAIYDADLNGVPLDVEHSEIALKYCDYMCKWYNIDYAYAFVPDTEKGTIRYIGASYSENADKQNIENNFVGVEVNHILTNDQLKVWNGETLYADDTEKNEYGHEITTVTLGVDNFGNKMLFAIDLPYSIIFLRVIHTFSIIALIIAVVIVGIYIMVYIIIRKRVSRPTQVLSRAMNDFITDGHHSSAKLPIEGDDEFSLMTDAFNRMTDDIESYVKNIGVLTREQEQKQTQIDIAARIQKGFLPKEIFTTDSYDINAFMSPAADVGGDWYDYLPLDENRTLLVIADVSGKGISAAIFMAVTLMLVRQFAKLGLSPSEILKETNTTLSENNAAMLFATVFVGIYDSSDKTLTYSNGGHNFPYIVRDELKVLKAGSGTLLGLFEGEEYPEAAETLKAGDTLFFYTDGVNEATDKNREFFGTKRLEEELKKFRASPEENLATRIFRVINEFSGGAKPHDDVTVLTLTVKDTCEKELNMDIHELEKIKEIVLSLPLSRQRQLELYLAAEECFVNICSYSYEGREDEKKNAKVLFTVVVSDHVEMRFADDGIPFNPIENMTPPDDYDIDSQIGGLGNYIAFSNVDNVKYEYKNSKNILTFFKFFEEE